MNRAFFLFAVPAAAAAGCAETQAPRPVDPAALERLLVRLDTARDELTSQERDKLARAERMVAPLEKLQADKIDPSVAEALIGR